MEKNPHWLVKYPPADTIQFDSILEYLNYIKAQVEERDAAEVSRES